MAEKSVIYWKMIFICSALKRDVEINEKKPSESFIVAELACHSLVSSRCRKQNKANQSILFTALDKLKNNLKWITGRKSYQTVAGSGRGASSARKKMLSLKSIPVFSAIHLM